MYIRPGAFILKGRALPTGGLTTNAAERGSLEDVINTLKQVMR